MKKAGAPTASSLTHLLAWLDDGTESDGETYLEMRRRLVWYFQQKRCAVPEDLADETLDRVARKLAEPGAIAGIAPARYCYIIAKFVFLEDRRRPERVNTVAAEPESLSRRAFRDRRQESDPSAEERARLLDCLDACLDQLSDVDRRLILDYYRSDERSRIEQRRVLAADLGLTANALAIRACRLRDTLEACLGACMG